MGAWTEPIYMGLGTWLEPEALCYPEGGMTRHAWAINTETGRFNRVRCGIPDSFWTIPAAGGYLSTSNGGILLYYPKSKHKDGSKAA